MEYLNSNSEYEKNLLNELPENLKDILQKKLSRLMTSYWKILSEVRSIVIFFKRLGLQPNDIDVKTFKNKDVDFVVDFKEEKIYIEVKGFNPDKETTGEYSSFVINTGNDDIYRALNRANDKFLENSCNIVVVADEDIMHSLGNKKPLELQNIFKTGNYKKISAFIILGPLREKDPFEPSNFLSGPCFDFTSIVYNSSAQKQLPKNLKTLLNKNLSDPSASNLVVQMC